MIVYHLSFNEVARHFDALERSDDILTLSLATPEDHRSTLLVDLDSVMLGIFAAVSADIDQDLDNVLEGGDVIVQSLHTPLLCQRSHVDALYLDIWLADGLSHDSLPERVVSTCHKYDILGSTCQAPLLPTCKVTGFTP